MNAALELAKALATQPGFDAMHDGNPTTSVIDAYHDPVGFPTQGYGRLLSRVAWEDLSKYPPISLDLADRWILDDLTRAQRALYLLSPVRLETHQAAALIDFIFNCGSSNYSASALRRVVNRGELDEVPTQLRRWVYASGVRLRGLERRRAAEARLFVTGEL